MSWLAIDSIALQASLCNVNPRLETNDINPLAGQHIRANLELEVFWKDPLVPIVLFAAGSRIFDNFAITNDDHPSGHCLERTWRPQGTECLSPHLLIAEWLSYFQIRISLTRLADSQCFSKPHSSHLELVAETLRASRVFLLKLEEVFEVFLDSEHNPLPKRQACANRYIGCQD